jgi:protein-disulfide isomerase
MEKKQNLTLPIAIVIAGIIVAGTIYYTNTKTKPSPNNPAATGDVVSEKQEIKGPKEITSSDHILGNPDAPLTFIVFTDLECPWCKKFHETVLQMTEEYGKKGEVMTVFRHFPLDALHQKSRKEAEASECAADLGGNEKFWQYTNRLFAITPSNDGLNPEELPKIAEYIGLDKNKFTECLNSGKFTGKVQENYDDAIASGGQGTPYFVIINQKGEKFPFSGYLPYDQLKIILDQLLAK